MMQTKLKKPLAFLLVILLVIAPLAGCNAANEAPAESFSELETLSGAEILTQTLQTPAGLQGFALGWDADPNELIEIGVQFVTPPAVALRLLQEEQGFRALSAQSYEEQAQVAHDIFWEQMAPLTRARTAQIEILSEHYLLFNGIFMRVPVHMVEQIAALPEVFAVMPNERYEHEPIDEPTVMPFSSGDEFMQGISELFDLDYIHNELGITGAGVRVGFEDTGIYHDHPRFAPFLNPETGRIRGWSFPNNIDDPFELDNHGTRVTGPVIAIAPGVELWHFIAGGNTFQSMQLIEMAHQVGIDVLNRSWVGRPLFDMAHNLAVLDGMIIVNSAGNSINTPFTVHRATDSLIISVGAGISGTDYPGPNPDQIARHSSRGPSRTLFRIAPDIMATGSNMMTTYPGGGYRLTSGTSMSAPVITAVAALLLEAFPDAPPYEIKARMMNTSRQLSVQEDNSVFNIGAGFVQPIEALTSTAFATVQNGVFWAVPAPSEDTLPINIFKEMPLSSLSFGAITENASRPLTVTIHNPGAGTWVPEVRYNHHLRDHSGVSLVLIDSDTNGEAHTFTYQMTFRDSTPSGMYEGNLVFTNEMQEGQFLTIPFGAYFRFENSHPHLLVPEITPASELNFGTAYIGYTAPPALPITVSGALIPLGHNRDIVLSGPDMDSFTFEAPSAFDRISQKIMVQPKEGLPVGTHRATITLLALDDWGLDMPRSVDVSFTVLDPATARTVTFRNDGIDTPVTAFPNHPIDWGQSAEAQEIYNTSHEFATWTWGEVGGDSGQAFWGWFRPEELIHDRGFPENRPTLGATGLDLSTMTFTENELDEGVTLVAVWSHWGDVNDDGMVNLADILLLHRYLFDRTLETPHFNPQLNLHAADVNVDGVVDSRDTLMFSQWLFDQTLSPHFYVVLGRPAP